MIGRKYKHKKRNCLAEGSLESLYHLPKLHKSSNVFVKFILKFKTLSCKVKYLYVNTAKLHNAALGSWKVLHYGSRGCGVFKWVV